MKIGIDARALTGRLTGDRTYWRGLLKGFAEIDTVNEYRLLVRTPPGDEDKLNLPHNFLIDVVDAPSERYWSIISFARALNTAQVDVAHMQYTVPPSLRCPSVTTVHDISFRLFPKLFSFKDRTLLNLSVPSSMRRASAVITVSENSRADILAAYPFLSPEKITATPLAVTTAFHPLNTDEESVRAYLSERYCLESPYVLSVGVLQPRKNLPMLIDAFVDARREAGFPHKLAIVGKVGWLSAETEAAIIRACNDVNLLGYVPDEDLPLLYGCADITVYPSLYEGFGLPVLEAMACGSPVITSNNSSLPEVAGQAGILLSAQDQSAWESSLVRLTDDALERRRLRTLGIEQAAKFSWQKTARATLDVYNRVVGQTK